MAIVKSCSIIIAFTPRCYHSYAYRHCVTVDSHIAEIQALRRRQHTTTLVITISINGHWSPIITTVEGCAMSGLQAKRGRCLRRRRIWQAKMSQSLAHYVIYTHSGWSSARLSAAITR